MPVYVTAAGDAARSVCDGGVARRKAYVEKYGLSMDAEIDLRDVLTEYGVNDVLFLLGVPVKRCQMQATQALLEYAAFLTSTAHDTIYGQYPTLSHGELPYITLAMHKLCSGSRVTGALVSEAHRRATNWHSDTELPEHKLIILVLVALTKDLELHDAVTKADTALAEWAVFTKQSKEFAQQRRETIEALLQ